MQSKVSKASQILETKLEGRGTIDIIHQTFKQEGLFDDYFDVHKIKKFEMSKTRQLLRDISIVIETEEGKTRIRGVHNVDKWQDGEAVHEYVMLRKMTKEEVELVAQRYGKTGRVYIAIEGKLMDVVTGQMMLFNLKNQ